MSEKQIEKTIKKIDKSLRKEKDWNIILFRWAQLAALKKELKEKQDANEIVKY